MDNSDSAQNKNQDENSDKSAFERFEYEIKSIIFGILTVLLKDVEISFWGFVSFAVINIYQMYQFVFDKRFPWGVESVTKYVDIASKAIEIDTWIELAKNLIVYVVLFYFCIFLVVLVILNIVFVAYSYVKKKSSIVWPVLSLRLIFSVSITVLFMPILQYFASIFKCSTNSNGINAHTIYTDMQCWQGLHIIHASFGIIFGILFVIICIIAVYTFFETKSKTNNPSARSSPKTEIFLILYKTVMVLAYTFFSGEEYRWLLILLLCCGSTYLFYIVSHERPYYNEKVSKLMNCLYGGYMYASYVVLIVMLLNTLNFSGGLQLIVIGYPIFIVIIVVFSDGRNKILLKLIDDFDSGKEWALKVRYFLTLLTYKDTDKYFNNVLKGYIYDHEDTCNVADCPLKAYKTSIMGMMNDKKKKQSKGASFDNILLLLNFANRMFVAGVNKFPECSSLHIYYAFFLIEHMGNKNRAVIELGIAEKSHPSFDEEFIIFRYKKIIEDEMQESHSDNNGSLDMVNGIAYENHVRQCKSFIEKAAHYHHEFWTLLMEDKPDFIKLDKSGSKINSAIAYVEDHWVKLQKIIPNEPKSLKMYAEFLIEIMNDNEAGGELLSRAKDTINSKNNAMEANVDQNLMQADGAACIVASGETNKLGEIMRFNQAACRVFGYNSIDLQGRKISLIIPEMLTKYHDQVMLNTVNNNDDLKENTEKIVMGKHKSGYIIPLHKIVRACSSFAQGLQFFATFRAEKKSTASTSVSYVMVDSNKEIRHLSSSAYTMLQLSNRLLQKARCNISTFCPSMFEANKFSAYISKGDVVEYCFPEAGKDDESVQSISGDRAIVLRSQFAPNKSNEEFRPRMNASLTHKKSFKCQIKIISFNDIGQVGHFIRLESIPAENQVKCKKYEKIPEFQYLYNVEEKKYYRVMQKPKETDLERDKKITEEEIESSFEESKLSFSDDENNQKGDKKEEPKKEATVTSTTPKGIETVKKSSENDEDEEYEYEEYDEDDYEESEGEITEEEDKKGETKKDSVVTKTEEDAKPLTDEERRKQNVENFLKEVDVNEVNYNGDDENGMAQLYKERMDYSKTVATQRLGDDGNVINIQENQNEEEAKKMSEDKKDEDGKEETSEDKNLELFRNNIKSKKALNAAIKEKMEPPSISKLKKTAYIVLATLLILISTEYGIILSQFSDISENLKLVEYGYQRESLQMRIIYDIGKLVYYSQVYANNTANFNIKNYKVNQSRIRMEDELNQYYSIQNSISMSKISLSSEHNTLYNSKVVTLYFKETSNSRTKKKMYFTLTESILQMTSSIFTILNLALQPSNFNATTQDDINFVLYNGFSDIHSIILQSSNLYVVELIDRSVSKNKLILIFFILSLSVMFVSIAICFPIIISVSKTRMGVLQMFLNIPMATIKILIQKCEKYTNKTQDDANEESDSLNNESFNNMDNSTNFTQNNSKNVKKRDFSNNNTSNTPFFLKYIFGGILLEAYFIVNYSLAIDFLSRVKGYGAEMNATALLEAHNTYVMSLLQNLLVFGKTSASNDEFTFRLLASKEISYMYILAKDLQNIHNDNHGTIDSSYDDTYIQVMRDNICNHFKDIGINISYDCASFISGTTQEGLHPMIINFIETVRQLLVQEIDANSSKRTALEESVRMQNIGMCLTKKTLRTISWYRHLPTSRVN